MRMGNLLRVRALPSGMAAKNHSVGIDHVTVVPDSSTPSIADDGADEDDEH